MTTKFTDFNLDANSYAAFDATSLRDLIINRLNDQNIFTDQIFKGSNMSSMIDIVAYSYHVLLYYLNKTSSESMFSDSVVYENMNRIVKLLDYKPVGYRTSTCTFGCTNDSSLPATYYTIPRYSFVSADGIIFSTKEDIPYNATTSQTQVIDDSSKYIMYQGKYQEYADQISTGDSFETIVMSLNNNVLVDHHSIDVYVRSSITGQYTQWTETSSLFLSKSDESVYELRLNENYRYEIKFGDNIHGKKLNPGDVISIYYVASDGSEGIISPGALNDKKFALYSTNKFAIIKNDIKQEQTNYFTLQNIKKIITSNDNTSTDPQSYENVSQIRKNAPNYFAHQKRLVTTSDFETYIDTTYGNIITSVKVANNNTYINQHMKYMADELSLQNPILESRLLSSHVDFANTSTQNNIYIYVVPRLEAKTSIPKQSNFLSFAQKENIKNGLEQAKSLGLEPVFVDPVYMAVDLFSKNPNTALSVENVGLSKLYLVKNPDIPRDNENIKAEAIEIIKSYFKHTNIVLGQTIKVSEIQNTLLSIIGVQNIYTADGSTRTNGLGLAVWNPVYTQDINFYSQDVKLQYFKFPYLNDIDQIASRIVVES